MCRYNVTKLISAGEHNASCRALTMACYALLLPPSLLVTLAQHDDNMDDDDDDDDDDGGGGGGNVAFDVSLTSMVSLFQWLLPAQRSAFTSLSLVTRSQQTVKDGLSLEERQLRCIALEDS
jgi:hypothetical protein